MSGDILIGFVVLTIGAMLLSRAADRKRRRQRDGSDGDFDGFDGDGDGGGDGGD